MPKKAKNKLSVSDALDIFCKPDNDVVDGAFDGLVIIKRLLGKDKPCIESVDTDIIYSVRLNDISDNMTSEDIMELKRLGWRCESDDRILYYNGSFN